MQTNHSIQDNSIARQQLADSSSNVSSTRTSALGGNTSSLLLGRPLSLGNLLIHRDSLQSKTLSVASKRSFDVLSPVSPAFPRANVNDEDSQLHQYASVDPAALNPAGGQPTSSTTSTSSTAPRHALTSPTGSIHSIASTSTASTTTAIFPSAARSVLLPQNGHGVRTRVNILPASAAVAANKVGSGLSVALTKDRRTSLALQHSAPSTSTAVRSSSPQPRYELADGKPRSIGKPNLGLGQVIPPPRVQSASSNHTYTSHMQDRSNTPSPAPQSTTQIDARRTVSDSTAAPATATTSTAAYRFPAPARSLQGENHTYTYGSSSTSTSARAASPKSTVVGSGERSDFGSLVANPSSSLSATGSSSSVSAALPSFGAHDGGYSAIQPAINGRSYAGSGNPAASARQRQQPPYHRSHTADEIHTASPFELSSDGTLTRPNAPFTSHSAKPSRTHLANLPKSLIPGGYDFSPTSTSAHESPPYPRHHQTSAPASAFAFARDRSASVPRTVSSTEDDSSRSSIDQTREGSRMPTLHEVDATFVTAKHTLESASLRTNRGDDSGHAQFISAFSNSSHPASSRQSTEEENASMLSHDAVAPLISPIPPKLDLDFGNSSGFSLDFGGDFGGSLGLTFGSGAGGGSAAYQRGDFGESRLASKAPHSPAIATTIGPTKQGGEAELETRDTKSTMASFLSLQDSTLSSQDDDSNFLFLADSAVEGPPMSANSDCTLQSLQRQNRADISAKAKPVDQQQQVTSNAKRIPEADPASRKGLLISSPEMTIPASTTNQQASQPIAAIRSESPASFISMSSVSRPLSSLSTGNPSISDFSLARKRLLDNSAYKQEYASSDDSKRTTLSSGEQVQFKTSQNSSVANLPNQGAQHNANVRASFNKSLPPVPPKSPSQARTIPTYAAEANASQPSTLKKASQLHSANSQDSIGLGLPRDFSGTARRSYSEHGQSYNEHRPALSYVRHNSDYTAAPGERRTSSLNTVERPSSQASGADNASLRSTTSSAYASLDNTRTFSAPNVPDVTRAYRPSRDSEEDVCHGRSETARPRANTVDHFQGIKNAFDKDGISLQDATVAKLARPKTNVRNAWPGGELRKRDAVTDRVLVSEKSKEDEIDVGLIQDVQETVSAKLAMWLSRHPERLMTAEEAELHNSLSLLDATNTKEARLPNELQSSATTHPAAQSLADSSLETSSLQSTQDVNKRRPPGASLVDEAKAAPATARLLESKSADATSNTAPLQTRRLPQNDDHVSQYPVPGSSTLMQTNQSHLSPLNTVPSSLPALTTSSSLTVTTGSDSLASTCKNSEPIRTPLTAVASSPSLDPAFASTVPLKILPKNRSGNLARTAKPLSPGGEQPWTQAWTDIGENLISYRGALTLEKQDRATLSQNGFVPAFRKEEHIALLHNRVLSDKQKELLLDWVDVLFDDLKAAPPNRGACLDGIAIVIESRLMNYFAFAKGTEGFIRYERTIASLAEFAVEKLNGKAIFANTLGFAGKMLAAAFWNLEGVGLKLLRLLPAVKKQHIARIYADAGSEECPGKFPPHLEVLSFEKSPSDYVKAFPPVRADANDTYLYKATFKDPSRKARAADPGQDPTHDALEIRIEMTGNWLIRWTATDSDLPFAFMRAYHRQLSNYMPLYQPGFSEALTTARLVRAPGYIFVAATLLEVCDALIHRNLRSVTTMAPSNTGVNANESANLAAGQKPKSLEIVSKRVIQTVFEIVGGSLQAETPQKSPIAFASAALRHNFGASVSMWLRAITKRTSMWDTRGIFALLDLIEGLMYNVCCPPYEEGQEEDDDVWVPSEVGLKLFDTKFILSFIKTILSKADNTTCLLRTISFLYTEFQSFTLREEDRDELCTRIILDSEIFNRLFLYYNVGVRGYFLRLLVYRLARLGSSDDGKPASRDPAIIAILRLFEYRLEKIRKRHDEIDPLDDDGWDSDTSDDFRPRPKRSTVCSTWGVRNKPWTVDLAQIGADDSSESDGEGHTTDTVERMQTQIQDSAGCRDEAASLAAFPTTSQSQCNTISQDARQNSSSPSADSTPAVSDLPRAASEAKKTNVAKSALKVWNALTHRKGTAVMNSENKKKPGSMAPVSESGGITQITAADGTRAADQAQTVDKQASRSPAIVYDKSSTQIQSNSSQAQLEKKAFPAHNSNADENTHTKSLPESDGSEHKANVLAVELSAPRLLTQSSRKSIKRGAAGQLPSVNGKLVTSAVSPRSRRSSLYSFDLDVETPRSDSFDLPRSPLNATTHGIIQSGSASPALGSRSGVLSLSPVAFGALLDGALNFDSLDTHGPLAERSGDRLNPGEHKRHKSISSARNRSRPVSVASDRTGPSPRVSKRFSKRASILPPQALDLLKESPSEPVPKIPEQYKSPTSMTNATSDAACVPRPPSPEPYEHRLHPYAIRGLREYEDCLDEWVVHRVKEEEGIDGRELAALIPRLQCAWPSTWED